MAQIPTVDVFEDRLHRLQQQGFAFPGVCPFGELPINIVNGRVMDSAGVDLLLELGEAAARCTDHVNWVTGVLQFLSRQALDDEQIGRAAALRRHVQLAVRFHPDPEVAARFDAVKALTDQAVRALTGT